MDATTMRYDAFCAECGAVTNHLEGLCLTCRPMPTRDEVRRGPFTHPAEENELALRVSAGSGRVP
jgi:hypothetical protein